MVKPGETPEHLVQAADFTGTTRDLVRLGRLRRATAAAYFAVFHTVQALLATVHSTAETHAGVLSMLAKHFVKDGPLPAETSRRLSTLLNDRLLADYGVRAELDLGSARAAVKDAAAVILEMLDVIDSASPASAAEIALLRQEATDLASALATPPPAER